MKNIKSIAIPFVPVESIAVVFAAECPDHPLGFSFVVVNNICCTALIFGSCALAPDDSLSGVEEGRNISESKADTSS